MSGPPRDQALKNESLAVHGGEPVRKTWLPYGHHTIEEDDIAAVVEVLRSGWITQGPKVEEFEHAVAAYCGAKYAVAFSSGTAALHAACVAAGLGPGDEVITTPLTFVATANSVVYCGAKPIFADIREDTLNIDPRKMAELITSRTKALMPVDFAGHPADLDPILSIAKRRNLVVIEDNCHALGAEYRGQRLGCISHMTVFSFHPVKHVTTAEGGMALTNDKKFDERLRLLRHHGIGQPSPESPWQYAVSDLGYNYRLSDVHSALGLVQMRRLTTQLARRNAIAGQYQKAFSGMAGISLPFIDADVTHAWHLFLILLTLDQLSVDRDQVLRALRAENVGATLHYPLIYLHPFYRQRFGCSEGLCPVAEAISPRMITLPLFPGMTDDDVEDVIEAVSKVMSAYLV